MPWIVEPTSDGWAIQLTSVGIFGSSKLIPVSSWASTADAAQIVGVTWLLNEVDEERGQASETSVVLAHEYVASIPRRIANAIGLPEDVPFHLDIQHHGTLASDDFQFRLNWVQLTGQPVAGARQVGSSLKYGSRLFRVPEPLYGISVAVSRFNAARTKNISDRLAAWADIQELLPVTSVQSIKTSGYISSTRVARAGKFSLSLRTGIDGFSLEPLLFGAHVPHSPDDDLPNELSALLPPMQQEIFARERFPKSEECKSQYALGEGWYVVVDENVRRALNVVRKAQNADHSVRKKFAQNPRAFLAAELGDELDESVVSDLFIETAEYSRRVQDVGLWHPKVLPWVKRAAEKWLPESFGITVGGKPINLSDRDVAEITSAVESAILKSEGSINWKGTEVPATAETLTTLKSLIGLISPAATDGEKREAKHIEEKSSRQQHVLVITDNFENVGFKRVRSLDRPRIGLGVPSLLKSTLKEHQIEGLSWLQSCWEKGEPGVLLADDMGLGKTVQALAFMLWLAEAKRKRSIRVGPTLIVAPTGLLKNWEQEHGMHLEHPGLGRLVRAFGSELKLIRRARGTEIAIGEATLDGSALTEADWVLTTYETLRDYQHSFAAVKFGVVVFDEIQKIKVPGTIMTHAAKALNTEFIIGLTGTPIENRLADLWCLFDTIQPGFLGDLADFSKRYEKEENPEELRKLKSVLTTPKDDFEPLMLRRMKADRLKGMPAKIEHQPVAVMPEAQANAYSAVLRNGRQGGPGKMLEVLQGLRSVSLHPVHPQQASNDDDYIRASARLKTTIDILDSIYSKGEKALIFVESQEMQPVLGALLFRKYRLKHVPMIINGTVSGAKRQERVNKFQSAPRGFDVIILSPRAGGVGLTLTAATHVIHLSRWWNPAVEDQCTDRAYRIGQTKDVHVHYPQAVHPALGEQSFDIRLHALLERKRALSKEMLIPPVGSGDARTLYNETMQGEDRGEPIDLQSIDTMEPTEFEHWVLHKLKTAGHQVSKTPKSHDLGADGIFVHRLTGQKYILQCKHTQSTGSGVDKAIDDLLKARAAYLISDAKLIAVTNNPSFGTAAVEKAKLNGIKLVDRSQLSIWPTNL